MSAQPVRAILQGQQQSGSYASLGLAALLGDFFPAGAGGGTAGLMDILPDVLAPGLALVVCGSAAGTVSARVGAYYAGPGNRFWPTPHAHRD